MNKKHLQIVSNFFFFLTDINVFMHRKFLEIQSNEVKILHNLREKKKPPQNKILHQDKWMT